ncbi:alkaline phosphatase D family protein [Streptomyces sp. NBC_01619]|uniref:Alkaline phosphatase D family protein n=1 Tax=Streptomyces pratisoli TaxID=3139917 RepID=A0ACC6QFB7_9ACTN|nr:MULTISPECIES: alkaline phosphatase D family protein [unclassified Streptomyces]MCX4509307.1 alkaline phosphatase D family protein [Streptomyces sp. NBC_01619]
MAAGLRLGPLLRYVDWDTGEHATIWIEADRPCTAEVRCADAGAGRTGTAGSADGTGPEARTRADAATGADAVTRADESGADRPRPDQPRPDQPGPDRPGAGGSARTFQVEGHHYALIPVSGLTPASSTAYEVLLDGRRVWPLDDSPFPPSTIRTPAIPAADVRVAFGSCRWAAPPADEHDPIGPDALDTLAARLADDPDASRPDVLVLLGDQVYADATSQATQRWLAARRDLNEPPGVEVADYEEYTRLYDESWLDPVVRWLLSTVPSCMIFDDHDLIDDWNTSASWLAEKRATAWWQERILSGLMSYWVYQHLGNLSPAELATDPVYAAVRDTPDGTDALRRFAATADADPAAVRWSYRRDFGRSRLLMIDTRAARVLDERHRAMLDQDEAHWLRDQALEAPGSYDHLLIGTSLPWLLPPLIHDAESWNAALCRGERGERWARFGEDLRRRADLEHWAAFPSSFEKLTALIAEVGSGPLAPATICVLSGDVHHAYVAEPEWPDREVDTTRAMDTTPGGAAAAVPGGATGGAPDARVFQLTCSPVHNAIHSWVRLGFRFGWSRAGRRLGHALARHGRAGRPVIDWSRSGGPWFGNQLMTLTLNGRSAELQLDQARADRTGTRLLTVETRNLTNGP